MPLPPEEENPNPQFEFSFIECFLFVLHKLGGECPGFFNDDQEKLKDFRRRLQYLARANQAYMKKLREDLQNKKGEELKKEENREKVCVEFRFYFTFSSNGFGRPDIEICINP